MMKIVYTEEQNLHISWITWGFSIKFSEKNITYGNIKCHRKKGFTLGLENTFWENNSLKNYFFFTVWATVSLFFETVYIVLVSLENLFLSSHIYS